MEIKASTQPKRGSELVPGELYVPQEALEKLCLRVRFDDNPWTVVLADIGKERPLPAFHPAVEAPDQVVWSFGEEWVLELPEYMPVHDALNQRGTAGAILRNSKGQWLIGAGSSIGSRAECLNLASMQLESLPKIMDDPGVAYTTWSIWPSEQDRREGRDPAVRRS